MSIAMQECEQIARSQGLAAGLARALSGAQVAATAPGRYAAVRAEDVPRGAAVRTHNLADAEDIVFLECPGGRPRSAPDLVEIGRLVAAVRLGVLRRMLDQAVEHLSNREAGGEPLVRKQLVTGTIADVIAGVELLRIYAQTQNEPAAIADVHNQIDELGWEVAKLFGAAGYIADHAARSLYVSALVANTWIDREGAER